MTPNELIEFNLAAFGYTRTFHLAPLLPCATDGSLENPVPEFFRVGEFAPGELTLAAALPLGCEFVLAESLNMPAWAQEAYDRISTIKGDCNGIVLYRLKDSAEVHAAAFVEVLNAGQPTEYLVPVGHMGFDTARYLDPESPARHDIALIVPPAVTFGMPKEITVVNSTPE